MLMKLQTLEVRWFFPGAVPPGLREWIDSLTAVEESAPRTDLYLLGTGDHLGIKLREGLIEAKKRINLLGEQVFSLSVSGTLEEWVKWSLAVMGPAFDQLAQEGDWLAVRKKRWLVPFFLSHSGQVELNQEGEFHDNGGSFELTEITVLGQSWWTFGVEVFGEGEKMDQILQEIITYAINHGLDVPLSIDHSLAYPQWLRQFAASVGRN